MPHDPVKKNRRLIFALLAGIFVAGAFVNLTSELWGLYRRSRGWTTAGPAAGAALPDSPAVGTSADIQRVMIVSVDGLRPDMLLRARTPRIRSLMARGSYSMWARTTEMSITLPSHTTMITGVRPDIHHIFWNDHKGKETYLVEVPTIFDQAKQANPPLSTGMCAGKSKFHQFQRTGTIDYAEVFEDGPQMKNLEVGDAAAAMIRRHAPRVMFVHLPDVDARGHAIGWGTPQQLAAVETADEAVGLILDALRDKGLTDHTAIILSADHGGQGRGHGPNDPRSRNIPWIAAGPGIRQNYDLTRDDKLTINTEDTFATACTLMRLPKPPFVDGKFVSQILWVDDPMIRPPDKSPDKDRPTQTASNKKKDDDFKTWEPAEYKFQPTPFPPTHN
jgi:hypothetical protein